MEGKKLTSIAEEKNINMEILEVICRNCPRAMSTYFTIFCRSNEDNTIVFTKREIMDDLSESYVKFKNDLRCLARQHLLEWHEMNNHLHVCLAEGDEIWSS